MFSGKEESYGMKMFILGFWAAIVLFGIVAIVMSRDM